MREGGADGRNGVSGAQEYGVENSRDAVRLFGDLFGVNIAAALKNCGGADIFKDAVHTFYDVIEEKSAEIQRYAEAHDWQNYTVQVHALKSSARLIGAEELSKLAEKMEYTGDRAKPGESEVLSEAAAQKIEKRTPELLALYRSYRQKLAPLAGSSSSANAALSVAPAITPGQLEEAFSALREAVSAFDFDSADAVIHEMELYALPPDSPGSPGAETFAAVKRAVQAVDRAAALSLLGVF